MITALSCVELEKQFKRSIFLTERGKDGKISLKNIRRKTNIRQSTFMHPQSWFQHCWTGWGLNSFVCHVWTVVVKVVKRKNCENIHTELERLKN
jgi:hypothetical protein